MITNPSAEFRADGSGGVINLISKKAKGIGLTGSARMNIGNGGRVNAGGSLGYNADKLTLAGDLNVRRDRQKQASVEDRLQRDPVTGLSTANEQQQVNHITGDSASARVSADYDLDPKTRLGAELRANFVNFRVDTLSRFTADDPTLTDSFDRQLGVRQKRANGHLGASFRRRLEGDDVLTLGLSYDDTLDRRIRSGHAFDVVPIAPDAFDQQRIDNHLRQVDLKGDYVGHLAGAATLKLGLDLQVDDNAYGNRGFTGETPGALAPNGALTNLFQFNQTIGAAYATYERSLGALTVLAGLRVEAVALDLDQVSAGDKTSSDYLRAYPSLHLGWKLSDSQTLTASYSHRVQRPDPGEFNSFRFLIDPLTFRAGNPNLKPQQTQSFELGYEYRHSPVLLLATAYYRENRDGVADVQRDLGGGVLLTERENVASSRSGGVELVANGRATKTLTYSLSGSAAWTELDSLGPTFAPTRSLWSFSGRGNLTWQATPNDLFQLNGVVYGRRLTPQGVVEPVMGANLGYRRKLSDQLALVATAQDIFATFGREERTATPVLSSHLKASLDRSVFVGFVWTLGGGRQKEPAFDFQGGPPPQ